MFPAPLRHASLTAGRTHPCRLTLQTGCATLLSHSAHSLWSCLAFFHRPSIFPFSLSLPFSFLFHAKFRSKLSKPMRGRRKISAIRGSLTLCVRERERESERESDVWKERRNSERRRDGRKLKGEDRRRQTPPSSPSVILLCVSRPALFGHVTVTTAGEKRECKSGGRMDGLFFSCRLWVLCAQNARLSSGFFFSFKRKKNKKRGRTALEGGGAPEGQELPLMTETVNAAWRVPS